MLDRSGADFNVRYRRWFMLFGLNESNLKYQHGHTPNGLLAHTLTLQDKQRTIQQEKKNAVGFS